MNMSWLGRMLGSLRGPGAKRRRQRLNDAVRASRRRNRRSMVGIEMLEQRQLLVASLSIDDSFVVESDVGQVNLQFAVNRSGSDLLSDISFSYNTSDLSPAAGAATAGIDYTPTSGTATIPGGATSTTINVPVLGDTEIEGDEQLFVNLTGITKVGLSASSFGVPTNFSSGSNPRSVTIGDLNGDGKPDLAIANLDSDTVSVLLNTTPPGATTPSYAAKTDFATGGAPISVAIADLNGDGKPDLATANLTSSTVSVLLNTTASGASAPSYATKVDFAAGAGPFSVSIGDLNGDGKPDLALADYASNKVSVLLNTMAPGATNPTFSTHTEFTTGASPRSVAIGDLNGDGKPDLATANVDSSTVSVLLNLTAPGAGTPTFSGRTDFATGAAPFFVKIGDLNSDGKPDLAIAAAGSGSVSVLLNQTAPGAATPIYTAKTDFPTGTGPLSVAIGDLDGDGKNDLAIANVDSNSVAVLINKTTPGATIPNYGPKIDVASGAGPQSVAITDLNGDGKPDLAYTNRYSANVSVLLRQAAVISDNQGTGTIVENDFDLVPPTVLETSFLASGTLAEGATSLTVTFSEPVNNAENPTFYALQRAGVDGLLGTGDDPVIALGTNYALNATTLTFAGLVEDVYRLTVRDTLTDLAGNQLDGDANSAASGDWRRDFVVNVSASPISAPYRFQEFSSYDQNYGWIMNNNPAMFGGVNPSTWGDGNGLASQMSTNPTVLATLFPKKGYAGANAMLQAETWVSYSSTNSKHYAALFQIQNSTGSAITWTPSFYYTAYEPWGEKASVAVNGSLVWHSIGSPGSNSTQTLPIAIPANSTSTVIFVSASDAPSGASRTNALGFYNNSLALPGGLAFVDELPATAPYRFQEFSSYDQGYGWIMNNDPAMFGGVNPSTWGDSNGVASQISTNPVVLATLFSNKGYAGANAMLQAETWVSYSSTNSKHYAALFQIQNSTGSAITWTPSFYYTAYQGWGEKASVAVNGTLVWSSIGSPGSNSTQTLPISIPANSTSTVIFVSASDAPGGPSRTNALGFYNNSLALPGGLEFVDYVNGVPSSATLSSSNGFLFDVDAANFGTGELLQGSSNAFDGLNRLQVSGSNYAPAVSLIFDDVGRTLVTSVQTLSGLNVSREITIPNTGSQDFARTVDVFNNPTGSPITTTAKIVGNLGSDGATTVFKTSDGDNIVETTDQWIGTDDADGTGTPAIIHYIHGPRGLVPTAVEVIGDNIYWTYDITVPAGETVRLAHFTILADDRATAEAAAAVLVTQDDFGGQATAFLTQDEIENLANFQFNNPPVAVDDLSGEVTIGEDDSTTDITAAILANDFDPDDGDTFSITEITNGIVTVTTATPGSITLSNGAIVSLDASGNVSFDPNGQFESLGVGVTDGTSTFNYTISDSHGEIDSASVIVTVTGTNDAPVAVLASDEVATEDGLITSGQVTSTDVDVLGNTATYSLDTAVAGLTFGSDGAWSFDPSDAAYQYLAAGEELDVVVNWTVTDDQLASDSSSFTITVTGTNDAPVANVSNDEVATEDGLIISGQVTSTDVDVLGTTATYSLDTAVAGLTFDSDGAWSFDPSNVTYQFLAVGEELDVVVSWTFTDDQSASDSSSFTITVTGTNDAPVAVLSDDEVATEDGSVISGQVSSSDVDVLGTTATYSLDTAVAGLTFGSGGAWSFHPSDAAYQHLAVGQELDVVVNWTVSDDQSASDNSSFTITVTGTNDAPVAVLSNEAVATENGAVINGQVSSTDVDVLGTTATYSLDAAMAGLSFGTDGTWSFDPSDAAYQYLAFGEELDVVVNWTVTDDQSASDSSSFTITVTGTNDSPVIDSEPQSGTINEAVDSAPVADADPTSATGTITFDDVDLSDDPTASITSSVVSSTTLANGNSLTAAQEAALLAGISIGPVNFGSVSTQFVTFEFEATVDSVGGTFMPGEFSTGELVSGTMSFDTSVTGTTTATSGFYQQPIGESFEATIGGIPFTRGNFYRVQTTDVAGFDRVELLTFAPLAPSLSLPPGFRFSSMEVDLRDTSGTALVNLDLPSTIDLSNWSSAQLTLQLANASNQVDGELFANITSLTQIVDTSTEGDVSWNYSISNAEIDFLGENDSVELTFTVQIADGNGGTDTQDVVITVHGHNDHPIIDSDPQTGTVDETVDAAPGVDADPTDATGTITFDDVDLSDAPTARITASVVSDSTLANGYVLTAVQKTALLGSLSLDPVSFSSVDGSGSVGWTYSVSNAEIDFLGDTDNVELTFTVTVDDNNGGTDSQDVVITVHGMNDAATISGDTTGSVTEDGTLTASGSLSVADVDTGEDQVVAQTSTAGTYGDFSVDANGSWSYTLNNTAAVVQALAAGAMPTETFNVVSADGTDNFDVVITVNGTNDAPIVDETDVTGAVTELAAATGNLTDSGTIGFSDVDLQDGHNIDGTITASTGALGSLTASVTTDTTGSGAGGVITWNYSVAAADVEYLQQDETKVETFAITLSDGNGGTVERIITVTITGTNDAPVAVLSNDEVATEDGSVISGQVTSTDVDLLGTTATYSLDTAVAGLTFGTDGAWSFDPSNAAYQYLAAGEELDVVVNWTVTDDQSASDNSSFIITVTGTNDAPVADVSSDEVATEDGSVVGGQVTSSDVDVLGTTANYSLDTAVAGLTFDSDGAWSFDPADAAYQYLAAGEELDVVVNWTVTDDQSASDNSSFTIMVTGTNDAPVIGMLSATSAFENGIVHLTGTYHDLDIQDTHILTINWGEGGLEMVAVSGGKFDITHQYLDDNPTASASDVYTIDVTLTDDDGGTTAASTTTTIANVAPEFAGLIMGAATAVPGQYVSYSTAFTDVGKWDSHTVLINWGDGTVTSGSISESIGSGIGNASGSHAYASHGTYTITFTLADDDQGTAIQSRNLIANQSIFVLHTSATGALTTSGNGTLNVPGVLVVDSSSSAAIKASGNARLTASSITVVGGVTTSGNAQVIGPVTHAFVPDPLAGLATPALGTVQAAVKVTGNSSQVLNPGTYASISVSGNGQLTLNPGVYILGGGGFSVSGKGSVTGNGVSIVNRASASGSTGAISFSGNGSVMLTPPDDGPLTGILIFQPADNTKAMSISGNAASGLDGTIYAPTAQLSVSGNGSVTETIIVERLTFSGNGSNLVAGEASETWATGNIANSQLLSGVLWVGVDYGSNVPTPQQNARFLDAVATLNAALANVGVSLAIASEQSDNPDIRVHVGLTGPSGDAADGVLGYATAGGDVFLSPGWDWFTGTDTASIGVAQYDYQSVLTHELGHAAGLEHSSDPNSVMYAALSRGVVHRELTSHDIYQLTHEEHVDVDEQHAETELFLAALIDPGQRKNLDCPEVSFGIRSAVTPVQARDREQEAWSSQVDLAFVTNAVSRLPRINTTNHELRSDSLRKTATFTNQFSTLRPEMRTPAGLDEFGKSVKRATSASSNKPLTRAVSQVDDELLHLLAVSR